MKLRLTILWLLTGFAMTAQSEFTLKSGEQLSQMNQFGRSTQELEAFIRDNPTRLYDQSQALLLISYNHMQLGDYANALAANEASLKIKAQLHADDLVNNYVRFGAIHQLRGNHHAALSYLLKAKDFPIEAIQLYAIIDGYLAAAYHGLGQYEQAETYYLQSIETLLIEYPENHPNIITSYYNLGKLYEDWGKPEQARQYFELGLDRSNASSDQAFLQALLNNGLGETYQEVAPRLAEIHHRRALDIATEFFGGYHRETALASLMLAKAIYRQQRRDEARDAIQLAIRSLNPEQPNLSWTQLPDTTRLILDRPLLAEALGLKARWLMDSALPDEQRQPVALANSEMAARLLQAAMNDRIDQEDRLDLLPIAREAFEAGIEAGYQLWKERKDDHAQWRAFQLAENLKVLTFRAHTGHTLQLTGTFAERERTMLRTLRLAEMKFRLQPLDLTVSQEVYRLRDNYRRLKEDWQRTEPAVYQQRFGRQRHTLRQVQANLAPDETLLSYFAGTKHTWLFALNREGLQTYSLAPKDPGLQVALFREAIDSSQVDQVADLGYQLYHHLLAPAAAALKKKTILSIVPDEGLEDLPFEALLTESYRKKRMRFSKLPFLVKEFAVQYRHTATSWDISMSGTPQYEFLYLSPVFDEERLSRIPPDWRILFDPIIHQDRSVSWSNRFQPLEDAADEAGRLQVVWGQSLKEGRFKMRESATEKALMQDLGAARYLHLSTYGFVRGASPEEAGLVLANPDPGGSVQNDGFLLASELAGRTTSATRLVSVGQVVIDEKVGILPLSGSLMLAGVPNVLYTGSPRNDGALFYPTFYEQLLEDGAVVKSSQRTRLKMIKDKATAAPVNWAKYRLLSL